MNSRTLDFADQIRDITNCVGVDIVLNSLSKEFITKSFSVLGRVGSFIEIGKTGIWSSKQVQKKRPDAKYFHFDLLEVCNEDGELTHSMLQEYVNLVEDPCCDVGTPRLCVFNRSQAIRAFRYMAAGKHMGKIILKQINNYRPQTAKTVQVSPDCTYVVVGGFGALGKLVISWLAEEGAKYVIVCSRSNPNDEAMQFIKELKSRDVQVVATKIDVSNARAVRTLLPAARKHRLPAIAGVVHAAGTLDDGMVGDMTWARF